MKPPIDHVQVETSLPSAACSLFSVIVFSLYTACTIGFRITFMSWSTYCSIIIIHESIYLFIYLFITYCRIMHIY